MGIVTAILNALRKAFKGKPATTAELKKTMTSLGLDDPKIMDDIVAAYKAEETSSLSKVKDLAAKSDAATKTNVMDVLSNPKTFTDIQRERGVGQFADDTIEGTFDTIEESGLPATMKNRAEADPSKFFEDMFNVEASNIKKIQDSTLAEIKAMDAQIQDLIAQGKFTEADAVAERLKDFQNQLKVGDLDAAIIPPDRILNANGGLIPPQQGPMSGGVGQLFKRRAS